MLESRRGVLVGATAKPYAEFTDRQTGRITPGGLSYRLYVSLGFDQAPIELKCSQGQYESGLGLGAGATVDVMYEVGAKNNKLVCSCVGLTPVSDNGVKVSK